MRYTWLAEAAAELLLRLVALDGGFNSEGATLLVVVLSELSETVRARSGVTFGVTLGVAVAGTLLLKGSAGSIDVVSEDFLETFLAKACKAGAEELTGKYVLLS
jgi:hypothetical protein